MVLHITAGQKGRVIIHAPDSTSYFRAASIAPYLDFLMIERDAEGGLQQSLCSDISHKDGVCSQRMDQFHLSRGRE